jgi:hypothetical protein
MSAILRPRPGSRQGLKLGGATSFDNAIRSYEHRWCNGDPERPGRFEVDDKVKLGGLFDRQVAGLGTSEHLVQAVSRQGRRP